MIPENITKDHVIKAIQEIDQKGIRKGSLNYAIHWGHNFQYRKNDHPINNLESGLQKQTTCSVPTSHSPTDSLP